MGGGPATIYSWNTSHDLTGITYPDGTTSSYRYDPFGRRVASNASATETRYVNDGPSVAADYNSSNQLQSAYLSTLESVSAGQARFYLSDGLGSVRKLTDSTGAAVSTYSYNSFGVPGNGNPVSGGESFAGYHYDSASGLYFAGARYYDPTTGRFLSEDPIGAVNPYPYAANDPANLTDIYGMAAAAEYAELLSDESDAAICESGFVAAVAGPSLEAAGVVLGGGVVTAAEVAGAVAGAMAENTAQCAVSAAGKTYARPKGYRSGIRDSVWKNNIERSTGRVRDPVTGRFISKLNPWDMGHAPGYEFRKLEASAAERGISRAQYLDEYNNPAHYRPELPSSNRSHAGELQSDVYFGP